MASAHRQDGSEGTRAEFPPTHWSVVLQAADTSTPQAQLALNELCRSYWFPLYAFIRIKEPDRQRARDLTQGFFVYLMERQIVKRADQRNGRFRSFLLACLQNYLTSEWRKETAQKRGGQATIFSIDEDEAEEQYSELPAQSLDPALRFDRAWAVTVIGRVTATLRQKYGARGRLDLFDALSPCLRGELSPETHTTTAAKLGMPLDTLRVNLCRFKEAFGGCVRNEVSQLVANPDEVDDEIRHLMAAWAGHLVENP